ncbi:MAG: acyl-CoA dehydrogenase [Erythrobacter sp.]|uniref:acyl-CoA dehydrogenase family protein n=1 Tax=Erythrobacter sp. TaxID=1042 RepID=UPI00263207F4|nr:acyl-CoA dehydrogenase [Erythrobacter sp.]MDJ0979703.1 acyl-CoA dehydrogenase [Erythrobacter sp.]
MNLDLTEDQSMLADSIERFGTERWPAADRWRLLREAGAKGVPELWGEIAELGWLMIPFAEEQGGLGGSFDDAMVLASGIGKHLLPVPVSTNAVLVAPLLKDCPAEFLEDVMTGKVRVALALGDGDSRFDHLNVATTAERTGAGYTLNGVKNFVADGGDADHFIVPARTSGSGAELEGISLFLLSRESDGLTVETYRSIDNHRHCRLRLSGAETGSARLLGEEGKGGLPLGMAVKGGVLAQCAEAVGAMDALCNLTLEYLKTRSQFGQPIGTFQSLQHRMVDMFIAYEEAYSITVRATLEAKEGVMDRGRMASAAKAKVGQTSLFVARQAIQLHGGIGTSDESVVSHYLRRLTMLDMALGNASHHLQRFAAIA